MILNRESSDSESCDSSRAIPRSLQALIGCDSDGDSESISAILLCCDSAPFFASRCGISGDSRPAILGIWRFAILLSSLYTLCLPPWLKSKELARFSQLSMVAELWMKQFLGRTLGFLELLGERELLDFKLREHAGALRHPPTHLWWRG